MLVIFKDTQSIYVNSCIIYSRELDWNWLVELCWKLWGSPPTIQSLTKINVQTHFLDNSNLPKSPPLSFINLKRPVNGNNTESQSCVWLKENKRSCTILKTNLIVTKALATGDLWNWHSNISRPSLARFLKGDSNLLLEAIIRALAASPEVTKVQLQKL